MEAQEISLQQDTVRMEGLMSTVEASRDNMAQVALFGNMKPKT